MKIPSVKLFRAAPVSAPATPLSSPTPDLAAPLVAQAAGSLKGVIDALAMIMISGIAPALPADPDSEEPGSALERSPLPRRAAAARRLQSCGCARGLSRTSRAGSG